jgi:hypothetical protein
MQFAFVVEFQLPSHGCHSALIFRIDDTPQHTYSHSSCVFALLLKPFSLFIWISSGLWSIWEYIIRAHCGVRATVVLTPFHTHFSNRRYAKGMYSYCSCVFALLLKPLSLFDMNKFRIMKQLGICNSCSLWSSSYRRIDAISHSFFESMICHNIRTRIAHACLHCSWNHFHYLIWISSGLWSSWECTIRARCGVRATVTSTRHITIGLHLAAGYVIQPSCLTLCTTIRQWCTSLLVHWSKPKATHSQ